MFKQVLNLLFGRKPSVTVWHSHIIDGVRYWYKSDINKQGRVPSIRRTPHPVNKRSASSNEKFSKALPYLKTIADSNNFKLCRLKDFQECVNIYRSIEINTTN